MRLEELTLDPTCIRFRVALAQGRGNLYLNFKSGIDYRLHTGFSRGIRTAMTQASPLRDCERQVRYFRKSIQPRTSAQFVTKGAVVLSFERMRTPSRRSGSSFKRFGSS